MRKFVLPAMAWWMVASFSAAAEELPSWLTERRIIGENNLEPIEAALGTHYYEKSRIVARVETRDGSGFCTASRVAADLFLTNYHCFEYKPCAELQFHMGYERDLPQSQQLILKCKEVLSKSLNLDYALYRVEAVGSPGGGGGSGGEPRSFEFRNLNVAIPDNAPAGLSESFDLDQEGSLTDLKIGVKIEHPYVGDLKVSLVAPSGKSVVLHDRSGGGAANIDRTWTFSEGLSALAGEPAAGEWKLHLSDHARQDVGKLTDVVFTVTTDQSPEAVTEAYTESDFPIAALWGGPVTVGQLLIVASHPAARLKEIDRSDNCKFRTVVPEVLSERRTITHTCDTEGGSSGSPVLDRETGAIVSLHWGGTNEYNLSIPMDLILADLEANLKPQDYALLTVRR